MSTTADDDLRELIERMRAELKTSHQLCRTTAAQPGSAHDGAHDHAQDTPAFQTEFQHRPPTSEVMVVHDNDEPGYHGPPAPEYRDSSGRQLLPGEADSAAFPVLFDKPPYDVSQRGTGPQQATQRKWAKRVMHVGLPQLLRSPQLEQEWVLSKWSQIEDFAPRGVRMQQERLMRNPARHSWREQDEEDEDNSMPTTYAGVQPELTLCAVSCAASVSRTERHRDTFARSNSSLACFALPVCFQSTAAHDSSRASSHKGHTSAGGPPWYARIVSNTQYVASHFGTHNTLFATLTANPSWEATANMAAAQPERASLEEDPNAWWDLHVRAFLDAKRRLEDALKNGHQLPARWRLKCKWWLAAIESQLRGLLHVHIAVHYGGEPWDISFIDELVWAHMPTEEEEELFKKLFDGRSLTALVKKHMIHKCYDHYCKRSGKCRFGTPWDANPATYVTEDGAIFFWRRSTDNLVSTFCPWLLIGTGAHCHCTVMMGPAAIPYTCGCASMSDS